MQEIPKYDEAMFQDFYKLYREHLTYAELSKISEEEYVHRLCLILFMGWRHGKLNSLTENIDNQILSSLKEKFFPDIKELHEKIKAVEKERDCLAMFLAQSAYYTVEALNPTEWVEKAKEYISEKTGNLERSSG